MAFWAQLLPGLRDVRVPLSVGALWIATGYLLWDRLPSALRGGQLVHDVENLAKAAPTAAVGSAATFTIYLLGIILNQIGSMIFNKLVMPILKGAGWLVIALAIVNLVLASWIAIVFIVAIFFLAAYLAWRQDREVSFAEHTQSLYNGLAIRTVILVSSGWDAIANAWNPSRGNVDFILKKEIERVLTESPKLVEDHIASIPAQRISEIARLLKITAKDLRTAAPDLSPTLMRRSTAKQLQLIRTTEEMTQAARLAIRHAITEDPAKMDKVLSMSLDKRKLRSDIRDRVDRANVRLKADHEGVYGEYDRLRAESELRLAIVAPLFALTATAGVRIAEDLQSGKDGNYLAWSIAGALGFLMLLSGREKEAEAADLLYSALRQELVENHDRVAYGQEFFPLRPFPEGGFLSTRAPGEPSRLDQWLKRISTTATGLVVKIRRRSGRTTAQGSDPTSAISVAPPAPTRPAPPTAKPHEDARVAGD